jgi:hypothetical protein
LDFRPALLLSPHPRLLTVLRRARRSLVSSHSGCRVGCHFNPIPTPPCDPSTLNPALNEKKRLLLLGRPSFAEGIGCKILVGMDSAVRQDESGFQHRRGTQCGHRAGGVSGRSQAVNEQPVIRPKSCMTSTVRLLLPYCCGQSGTHVSCRLRDRKGAVECASNRRFSFCWVSYLLLLLNLRCQPHREPDLRVRRRLRQRRRSSR